jgi:hypothetical protein
METRENSMGAGALVVMIVLQRVRGVPARGSATAFVIDLQSAGLSEMRQSER